MRPSLLQFGPSMLLALLALVGMIAIGIGIVIIFRGFAAGSKREETDLLANFKELRSRGDISDQEFRTIKANLGSRGKRELESPQVDS